MPLIMPLKSGHLLCIPLQEAACSCPGLPGTKETRNHILVGRSEQGGPPELIWTSGTVSDTRPSVSSHIHPPNVYIQTMVQFVHVIVASLTLSSSSSMLASSSCLSSLPMATSSKWDTYNRAVTAYPHVPTTHNPTLVNFSFVSASSLEAV